MRAECYSLNVYCDNPNCWAIKPKGGPEWDGFTGETKGAAYKEARERGWVLGRVEPKDFCPICSGRKVLVSRPTTMED